MGRVWVWVGLEGRMQGQDLGRPLRVAAAEGDHPSARPPPSPRVHRRVYRPARGCRRWAPASARVLLQRGSESVAQPRCCPSAARRPARPWTRALGRSPSRTRRPRGRAQGRAALAGRRPPTFAAVPATASGATAAHIHARARQRALGHRDAVSCAGMCAYGGPSRCNVRRR